MLKFLGVLFLIIIGLVVAFFTWLFFKVKSGVQQQARVSAIEEGMNTPAIVLEPTEHPSLAHPEAVAELVEQVVRLGATTCGDFNAPAAGARLCSYRLETPPVYVVIYDHDQVEPWVDVVLRLDQDRSFTASTAPEISRGAPRHPDDDIMYFAPGTVTGVLVQAAVERANGNATLTAPPEEFKSYFEEAAEKSRQYIQTQTVSQEWLSTIAEDAGVELSGDEAAQINFGREEQQVMQTENACFKSLAESGQYTAAQWNDLRDSLVAVWDDMPAEHVSAVFYNHVDVPEGLESAVDALEESRGLARERVAQLNAGLPDNKRLILVGTVSSPVEADIYEGQIPVV
ncbi:MAG: hypothetical protein ACR2RD_11035 [Woeseiaceae bacterium]